MSMAEYLAEGSRRLGLGQFDEAEEAFRQGTCRFPNQPRFLERMAFVAYLQKDLPLARSRYESLAAAGVSGSLSGLGTVLAEMEDYDAVFALVSTHLEEFLAGPANPRFLSQSVNRARDLEKLRDVLLHPRVFHLLERGQILRKLFYFGDEDLVAEFFRSHADSYRTDFAVIGDSHAGSTFGTKVFSQRIPPVFVLPGATIAGFGKRKSTLGVFRNCHKVIAALNPSTLLFKFGQVNVDLGIYYRQFVKNMDINIGNFFIEITKNYIQSIIGLPNTTKYIVCGINMPTLVDTDTAAKYTSRVIFENKNDENLVKELHLKLQQNMPPYEERFQRSLLFNEILRATCEHHGIAYFDLVDLFCQDGKTLVPGIVRDDDHHYFLDDAWSCKVWNHVSEMTGLRELP
ncbi:hypothetical protein ASZ90_001927 [hydrocarbon metagenome]|uniref:Tetratricopeptide repeat protein n=1 Tax=hydrocarbon metagenome TaxID=938273 RepID=A0A0W8G4Z3_9ZZZZ